MLGCKVSQHTPSGQPQSQPSQGSIYHPTTPHNLISGSDDIVWACGIDSSKDTMCAQVCHIGRYLALALKTGNQLQYTLVLVSSAVLAEDIHHMLLHTISSGYTT